MPLAVEIMFTLKVPVTEQLMMNLAMRFPADDAGTVMAAGVPSMVMVPVTATTLTVRVFDEAAELERLPAARVTSYTAPAATATPAKIVWPAVVMAVPVSERFDW